MLLIAYDQKPQPMRIVYRLFGAAGFLSFLNQPLIFELWYGPIRRAAPGIGGVVVILVLLLATGLFVWRTLAPLFGPGEAVRSEKDDVIVRTQWRTHRIRWRDLDRIAIRGKALLFYGAQSGAFGPLRVAVPLRATTLHHSRWQSMLSQLHDLQAEALGQARNRPAPKPDRDDAPASDFDPDAALARYLARKAAAAIEPQAVPPLPRPGGFGRKGI
jgi:hypothetical protein